jgi:hypothetical protein
MKMNLVDWNKAQIEEALSDLNRYYYWERYGREAPSDDALLLHYAMYGGALHFRNAHDSPDD